MTAYLIEHPPRIRQFRERGTDPSGVIVVHTAESYPDERGPDTGAENVAEFIENRTNYGSYHDLADSDSIVHLVPFRLQAYGDGTGSNPHAYHVSAATQAHRWRELGDEWIEHTVRNMARASARYNNWLEKNYGISVPARRISRAESERRVPGFISHAERDPERRSDPGAAFPWERFLDYYAEENGEVMFTPYEFWNHQITSDERDIDAAEMLRLIERQNRKILAGQVDTGKLATAVASQINAELSADADVVKRAVKDAFRELVQD